MEPGTPATLHDFQTGSVVAEVLLDGDPLPADPALGSGSVYRFRRLQGRLLKYWSDQIRLVLRSPSLETTVRIGTLPIGEDGHGYLIEDEG